MDTTGRLVSVARDIVSKKLMVSFVIDTEPVDDLNSLGQLEKVDIKVWKHRKKRSLDANAYAWVLMTKLGEKAGVSKDDIYEAMLQKNGPLYHDEDGYITITVRADVDMTKVQGHWRFYKGNEKFSSYMMIKGSSEYDTAEMSKFIDELVLEAKSQGIETLPPAELERMTKEWRNE